MAANILFGVIFGVVALGLIVWVIVIVRRARTITEASDSRLSARLYAAANEPTEPDAIRGAVPEPVEGAATKSTPAILTPVDSTTNPADVKATGPKEARLAELADLHERGLITDDELAAARSKILAE